ncbi:YeiH family protein [Ectobacillus sp. sgz5001026]|uniref:YeiH family protein n=1 Tax=Ectobacillus sp. sgz5001026 TaxID=3242473 RepID=UPI0036D37275
MKATILQKNTKIYGCTLGILLTFVLALAAKYIALLPFFSIMGQLVIAILLGTLWASIAGVQPYILSGTSFSSKTLLRVGIILLGMRVSLIDIIHAGSAVFFIAVIQILFTLVVVYLLSRKLHVNKNLSILTACGTAICGAAAVVAIAQQIDAKDEETAVGAATIAILGTVFTLFYTALYPVLSLSPHGYGIFAGSTLHEIAHVIAAASIGGKEAVDLAVIVKLTRVALLIPVAITIGIWKNISSNESGKTSFRRLPIPWFILGFVTMSCIHSFGIVSSDVAAAFVTLAYTLLAMAMAGLGLQISLHTFRKLGLPSFAAGFIGSILLSLLGYGLIQLFHLT